MERGLRLPRGERGSLLMETTVALTIFTVIGMAVLSGLSTTHRSGAMTETQSVAENIARNQMEYVFSLPYQAPPYTYPAITPPSGYTVTAVAQEHVAGNSNIEKVVVTINHGTQTALVLETLRAR